MLTMPAVILGTLVSRFMLIMDKVSKKVYGVIYIYLQYDKVSQRQGNSGR